MIIVRSQFDKKYIYISREETANSLKDLIASFLSSDQVNISHADLSLASTPGKT